MTAEADDSFDSLDETIADMSDEQFNNLQNEANFDLGFDIPERFAKIDEAGVDEIAGLREEKTTARQTKWGTKIFKGTNY